MKTNIEISYFKRVDINVYQLVHEVLSDNLIFGR